ncbi:hypothetical protein FB99_01940 [Pantoea agglomerans]|nr:hypothetical protein FB99_01940 [Pantoea agglomerans]
MRQSLLDFGQHAFSQAIATQHNHWLERMGEALEVLFLFGT